MTRLWSAIERMPRRAQLGVLIGVGVLLAIAAGVFGGIGALVTVLVGSGLVVGGVVGWRTMLTRRDERRASPFAGMLAGSAAGPTRIAEPARRARLDDLRKSFETGIEKFRSAGKSLYSVPWYVLVGEPGSGKTEAVRHCGVGFPPGLHEELQGAGGTLNMSWWFTNQAVILDTAGRLLFEDVEPGSTSEWQEFLKLLKRSRPNCPVNGLLVVIPADSLIRDTDAAIDAKAIRLASQLDNIQKQLGVRFPAYVVITKSDLVNGFREFFDRTDDPRAANQILGWSNPDTLDAPFRPELVDEHLRAVEQRLQRRRMGLLLDPVHTEDPRKRRLDQVDALFAFPESLTRLAPRLRRYLDKIFVAGEWSARPLFLRGIYFTSALREGAALDADLAAALNVPLEKLPEGKIWERERALFLKDLFLSKVFKEKGLVTRAADTAGLLRFRALTMLGSSAAALVVIGLLTWMGAKGLQKAAVEPGQTWAAIARTMDAGKAPGVLPGTPPYRLPIVSKAIVSDEDFKYRGDAGADASLLQDLPFDDDRKRGAAIHPALLDLAAERIPVPLVFYPAALITGDAGGSLLAARREQAARAAFEVSVLRPLVEAAAARLTSDSAEHDVWTPEATGALAQLIRIEVARRGGTVPTPPLEIDPLLRFALLGNDGYLSEGAADDARTLQRVLESHAAASWPPGSLAVDRSPLIAAATDRLALAVQGSGGSSSGSAGRLAARLQAFADAEVRFLEALSKRADPAEWQVELVALHESAADASALVPALAGRPLEQAVLQDSAAESSRLRDDAARLLAMLSPTGGLPADKLALAPELARAAETLREVAESPSVRRTDPTDSSARVAALSAAHLGRGLEPLFVARLRAYDLVAQRMTPSSTPEAALPPGQFASNIATSGQQLADDSKAVRAAFPAGDSHSGLENCLAALAAESKSRSVALLREYAQSAPESEDAMLAAARTAADTAGASSAPASPVAPSARAAIDRAFVPGAAAPIILDALAAAKQLADSGSGTLEPALTQRVGRAAASASLMARRYADAWTDRFAEAIAPDDQLPWVDLHRRISEAGRAAAIRESLLRTSDLQQSAATAITQAEGLDADARKAVDRLERLAAAGRAAATSPALDPALDRVMEKWRALGPDAVAARRTLLESLRTPSGSAGQDYFVTNLADPRETDVVQRWWRSYSLAALRTLVRDAQRGAGSNNQTLARFSRFPLAKYVAEAGQLTPAELLEARAAMPSGSSSGAQAVAEAVRDPDFAAEVRALALADPLSGSAGLNTALLSVLPDRIDQRLACSAELTGDAGFVAVRVRSQGAEPRIVRASGGVFPLGRIDYPGSSVQLEFLASDSADGPSVATAAIPGPWLGLWLIAAHDGRPVIAADRRLWEVNLPVESASGPRTVRLRLSFEDRELPDPSRWPR